MLPSPQLLNKVGNFIKEQGKFSYYCLFLLGEKAGLRVSEAVNFDLSLKKKQNLYLIKGKRHKKRAVFIDPTVINELEKNSWKPNKTSRFSYSHYLQRIKKQLNISKDIELTPHTLRRCFATYQANNGMSLPVLQQVLGHSSIRTTALYWKSTETSWEKLLTDKWLAGKLPEEPPKPAGNNTKKFILENNWKIFVNIHQELNIFIQNSPRNSRQEILTTENKLLQAKIKQLEQENEEHKQIIIKLENNLQKAINDKEIAEQLLKQTQNEKETLLKLLSTDLKNQYENLLQQENKQQNIPELHQQLIAQIEISLKN